MSDRNLVEQLGSVLKKSRGEPSKLIELIVCIRDLNRQGKIASCSKIVRKLWFEEWTQAAIVQLDHQYGGSTKGKTAARTTIWRWTAAGVMMVLAITVSVLFIRNIYFHPPPAKNHFIARSTRNLEAFAKVLSGYHFFFQGTLDDTFRDMQRFEDAITYLEKFMRLKPKAVIESLHLAASYEAVGRDEEAQAIIRKVLRKDPTMTVEKVLRRLTPKKGKEPSKNEQLLSDQLRRAGLP